jgi:hypothetical protein
VRQRHVAHAEPLVRRERAEGVLDRVAALDADEDRDPALLLRRADAVDRVREDEILRMGLDEPMDQVDELEGLHRRAARLREPRADVRGEEGRRHAAFAPARDVDVTRFSADAEVHPLLLERLRHVLVRVDDDRAPVQAHRALVEVLAEDRRPESGEEQDGGQNARRRASSPPAHASFSGRFRRRFPVAAKTAFATAGAIGGVPGSPAPPAFSLLETMCTSTFGISSSRSTR